MRIQTMTVQERQTPMTADIKFPLMPGLQQQDYRSRHNSCGLINVKMAKIAV